MASRGVIEDTDITAPTAQHDGQTQTFERTYYKLKVRYRLMINSKPGGSLTDATHARQTIAYWRARGWITE